MEVKTVLLQTTTGGQRVPAHLVRGLAIHKRIKGDQYGGTWAVSHINTGLLVHWGFPTRKEAWGFALDISKLTDWNDIHDRADCSVELGREVQRIRSGYHWA